MLSFLSVSSFSSPSSNIIREQVETTSPGFWDTLKKLGFSEDSMQEQYAVLDPRRWEGASSKLGETVSYIDVSGDGENGIGVRRGSGSFFVDIMQQFIECLMSEMEALEQIEQMRPYLARELSGAEKIEEQEIARSRVETADKLMMQYHALIPARLSEFRSWAETYDLLPDARAFFFEYTKARNGQGTSLDAIFRRFTVT